MLPVQLRAGVATHAGRVRSQNQDRSLVIENTLYLVADGMGGHVGGEVAAQVTVDTLRTLVATRDGSLRTNDVVTRIEDANLKILTRADEEPDLRGMGTTLTGIAVVEGDATSPALLLIVNVGDSRTYWLRGGELEQLSDDHSVVGELIRDGKLTSSEARTHKSRSVLTRALGVEPGVECDVLEVAPIVGDRFLICSDGLPTELSDATIAATLRKLADPEEAASALVRDAVDQGGRDNVTVIVVDVVTGIDGSNAQHTAASRHSSNASADAALDETKEKVPKSAKPPRAPRGKRRPWIVNLRVLLFLAALAGIAAVVVWTLRNAPANNDTPSTDVIVSTTVDPVTSTITEPTTINGAADATTAPTTSTDATEADPTETAAETTPSGTASMVKNLSDPVPGAVVDPFATTTTTVEKTTTTRKRR